MWHCITGLMISDVLKDHATKSRFFLDHLTMTVKALRACAVWELLTKQQSTTSQKTWIISNDTVRTQNLILGHYLSSHMWGGEGLKWYLLHSYAASFLPFPDVVAWSIQHLPWQTTGWIAAIATNTSFYSEGFATEQDFRNTFALSGEGRL